MVSPDLGEHWSAEGAWQVAEGIHRILLPPADGRPQGPSTSYAIETDDGLTLIDGGWSIQVARDLLERCLRDIGYGFGDIRRFLVTTSTATTTRSRPCWGTEYDAEVALGLGRSRAWTCSTTRCAGRWSWSAARSSTCSRTAGAHEVAGRGRQARPTSPDPAWWQYPHTWLTGDQQVEVGARTLDAVHTPGHTPGHFVFADQAAGLLFAGDHVLPTITPSIGFTVPPVPDPLGDFMASLTKVRSLPDLRVLPAHGPVAPSTHARVDEADRPPRGRLQQGLAALAAGRSRGTRSPPPAVDPAREGVRRARPLRAGDGLDETKAHLDLLVAGPRHRTDSPDGVLFTAVAG